ncbi:hypothetical protein K502DRAFT_292745 [Neoconidiobolus thromboides FSU 785]|nr:hypothetical protein K502DRAFT_292745 [Neoconidiobolus thromboides FSU 785]
MDSDDEFFDECPICYEEIDIKDSNFKPCLCSFKICYFCYDRLVAKNEPCPACRREYKKEYITYEPISEEKIAKYEAKKRKELGLDDDDKKFMRNARITQYNLVYIQGLPEKYANIENLKKHECFGRYGKITKLVFANKKPETDKNGSLYITYSTKAEAENAIREIHNHPIFGGITKASFGTTKYCKFYLRKIPCPNSGCLYLHDKQLPEEVGTNAHSAQR